MRYFCIVLLCISSFFGYSQGFPSIDSLRSYNTKYTTNSALSWFTNQRGQVLLRGIIDFIDTVKTGSLVQPVVDTLYSINDSTLRYRSKGQWVTFYNKGVYDYRRKVDTAYAINDTTLRVLINGTSRDVIIRGRGSSGGSSGGFKNYANFRTISSQDENSAYIVREGNLNNLFKFDSLSSAADDSALTIVSSSGKRFSRVTDGYIHASWFGALPDDGVDDSYAFQKMWNYVDTATNLKEFKIFIQGGKYEISTAVTLPQGIYSLGSATIPRIYVEGYGARIFLTGAITGWARKSATLSAANTSIDNYTITIKGLEFVGTSTTGQKGLELHSLYGAELMDMRFTTLDTGLVLRFLLGSTIKNVFYTNNKSVGILGGSLNGVATSATVANSAFNANLVTKNRVYCASGSYAGMMFLAADGCDFLDNIIEGSKPRYSFYYDYESSSVVNGNRMDGMWFEASGGTYSNNVSMKIAGKNIFSINRIQNDYADTLIDWSNSAGSAIFILDNVEYWNWPGKYIKGTPSGGMQFKIGHLYGGSNIENFFNSAYYNDGIPDDVMVLYPYMNGANGSGITSYKYITIKPSLNFSSNLRNLYVRGNIYPDTTDTYNLGLGSQKWNTSYIKKGLFNLTAEDGTGAAVQVGGNISIANNSFINSPSYGRIGLTINGSEIADQSGGLWYTLRVNSGGVYWLPAGSEKFSITTAGEVNINNTVDKGAFTLQNVGGFYQDGIIRYKSVPAANLTDDSVLVIMNDSIKKKGPNDTYRSGTYTPTLYNTTNIASSSVTASSVNYQRIGDVVRVWGEVTITATANTTASLLGMSLPIASGLSNTYELAGTALTDTENQTIRINADATNDRASFRFKSTHTNAATYSFHFTYKYIAP